MRSPQHRFGQEFLSEVAATRVIADNQPEQTGTRSSGSGRSEMSSPGKAAWCILVLISPGSNQ